MPIDVKWYADKPRILLMEFVGSWGFRELERACLKIHEMAKNIEDDVYSIIYANEPFIMPTAFRISQLTLITSRPSASRCVKLAHIIAHKPHIHYMFNMYFRIYPRHRDFIKVVNSWQEAMSGIYEDQHRHTNDDIVGAGMI